MGKRKRHTLTQERLRELLDYDPETGRFVNKVTRGGLRAGRPAGAVSRALGYVLLGIDGQRYLAHRIAWVWMTGRFPSAQIDHINGIRDDNRWHNLREATHAENSQNISHTRSDSLSGHVGVGWHKARRRWRAYIGVSGRYMHLGLFDTFEAARDAYLKAKAELHTFQPTPRDA